MLEERYVNSGLTETLASKREFRPFPTICDRTLWDNFPEKMRDQIISKGEEYLGYGWDPLSATRYMDFVRNGNRSRYEDTYRHRRTVLASLLLAECVEDKGRFLSQIVDGIWHICEESSWVIPAHNVLTDGGRRDGLPDVTAELPYIDLFSAETASLLAWVSYFLKDRLDNESPLIARRIQSEVERRVFRSYLERDDFWWMGLDRESKVRQNNWNTWINANCLAAFLVLEEDDARRAEAVAKCMRTLDRFIEGYPEDGGCDEGPSYWGAAGASLFDCLELFFTATDGAVDVYSEPLIQNIGRYIYRVHIAGDYYVNYADAPAVVSIPSGLVFRYGCRINDQKMKNLGLYSAGLHVDRKTWVSGFHLFRSLCDICWSHHELTSSSASPPCEMDVWLSEIQVMAARERQGDVLGLYLTAKGGHNGESHNHNDVGQFMVYSDGRPAIIDAGVGDYTAKTFSPSRYEIWTMQSAYHNLPTIDGFQQQPGETYHASSVVYSAHSGLARMCLDIASAYPEEAGVVGWMRSFSLYRGAKAYVEIVDEFRLARETSDIVLSLMSPCEHDLEQPGVIVLQVEGGRDVTVIYDASVLSPSSERIEIVDTRLTSAWGDHIYRITLRSKQAIRSGRWSIRVEQLG